MDKLVVFGGSPLKGEVKISGAKNSALPIMAASLLTEEECVIKNVPRLSDVYTMIKILAALGKDVAFESDRLYIKHRRSQSFVAPYRLVRTMRASFCVLGPLLAKRRKAKVSLPGGCVIGLRPVDLHLKGLRALGAEIKISGGYCWARAPELKGREIFLGGDFGSSVLATANILMASVLAKGRTVIDFAACEPEVVDLAKVLKKMGAKIKGEGTPRLVVEGVKALGGFEHKIISDRIEAGTFAVFSLVSGGRIKLRGADPEHLLAVLDVLAKAGAAVKVRDSEVSVSGRSIKPLNITTFPYPGFPTDLQAQFMVLLSLAKGVSVITEKVYPDRFMHVAELNRMGARIQRFGPLAVVEGIKRFSPAEVMASDLRASAALVAAGLNAAGKTTIHRVYHLYRGYENLQQKLEKLGAQIKCENE